MPEGRESSGWVSFGFAFVGGYGDAMSYLLANTFLFGQRISHWLLISPRALNYLTCQCLSRWVFKMAACVAQEASVFTPRISREWSLTFLQRHFVLGAAIGVVAVFRFRAFEQ